MKNKLLILVIIALILSITSNFILALHIKALRISDENISNELFQVRLELNELKGNQK